MQHMPARILDGKALAAELRARVKDEVARLASRGARPGLAVILAGDDPASRVYVRNKTRACEETGVHSQQIHGILVQLPLPKGLDSSKILRAVSPAKDVDGFHPANLGALLAGEPTVVPGTPLGVMRLLEHAGIGLAGKRAVVIGRSSIVGKPLAMLLLQKDATVSICHSKSKDIESIAREADILVAAVGRAKLVGRAWVKPGACVIDVGINRLADGSLAGDVDFQAVKDVAGWITPVPGGVGPMTIAMMLENCLKVSKTSNPE
jgi:methylenetetrahydrofolate dehydrogenase (NADP+)/methenyltetrahydrofolate cyclohydrolase